MGDVGVEMNRFGVDFQIRSEQLQNLNKEMGYTRTDGRTHARTKTIFRVNGFKNPALRAGHYILAH